MPYVSLAHLPASLKAIPQWVCWRHEPVKGRQTKVPYAPNGSGKASSTDPATWATFEAACDAIESGGHSGLGFVFAAGGGIVGVDLDHCLKDGVLHPEAERIVRTLDSYTEISPSGDGLHVLLLGKKHTAACAKPAMPWGGECAIYEKSRFFVMTGNLFPGYPTDLQARQAELQHICTMVWPAAGANEKVHELSAEGLSIRQIAEHLNIAKSSVQRLLSGGTVEAGAEGHFEPSGGTPACGPEGHLAGSGGTLEAATVPPVLTARCPTPLTDDAILALIRRSKAAEKFEALWAGQWENPLVRTMSQSEADLKLCCQLAFYTRDVSQLDRLFRASGLMRPKWDEPRGEGSYGSMTLEKALARVREQYRGHVRTSSPHASGEFGEVSSERELVQLGQLDPQTQRLVLSPRRTLPTAESFLREFYAHPEGRTLQYYAGMLWRWQGNRYAEIEEETLKNTLQLWLHQALRYIYNKQTGQEELAPFESNPSTVKAALQTIATYAHIPKDLTPPAWLGDAKDRPHSSEILACKSLNLHIPTGTILPATPLFFSTHALEFDYTPDPPPPERWMQFLEELFGQDEEAIYLLQDWFGYCLTPDTSQQKMLLLVGPKRCGKGTIARILAELIGEANTCAPTTSGLAGSFGLQSLIGKSLAIISDARFSGEDVPTLVERLLCLSGEDALTIDRKHKEAVTLRLPTRMMFLSNELPKLADSSGALSSRFLILRFTESFLGREDHDLTDKLKAELPGILLWALSGWRRLHARGRFVQPQSAQQLVEDLEDLVSPIGSFVRDCTRVGTELRIAVDELYRAWAQWCTREGWHSVGTKASFGRDLIAAAPKITKRRHREEGAYYEGITLK
ncbi:MAG: hypothetical protein HS116_00330 [Planctomycetes bacterium]|nr:hypothetical protein [Planctomycetota bacterium]